MTNKSSFIITAALTALTLTPPTLAANTVTQSTRALAHSKTNSAQTLLLGDNSLPNLGAGVQELGLSASIHDLGDINYGLTLTYGYFYKDNWQIGFTTNISGEQSDTTYALGVFTEYNFVKHSKWVPFVAGSMKWARLNSDSAADTDSISLGLDLGLKYFFKENIAVSFSIGSDYALDDLFPGGDDFQETIKIGTRFYF